MAVESPLQPSPAEGAEGSHANDEWDPARVEQALRHLTQTHAQLRSLRTTIPTMLRPLIKPSGNPENIFLEFTNGVKHAANQISDFSTLMKLDITMEVFDRAELSKLKRETVRPWLVTEDEDWLDPKIQDDKSTDAKEKENEQEQDEERGMGMSDEEEILGRFREMHPSCQVQVEGGRDSITVTLSPSTGLTFRIERKFEQDGKVQWVARCEGERKLHMGIQQCIDKRGKVNDLRYLLEMLASYDDIYSRNCTACGSLLDSKPQLPVIRKRVKKTNTEGNLNLLWEAYHEGCI